MTKKQKIRKGSQLAAAITLIWLSGFLFFLVIISSNKPPSTSLYSEAGVVLTGGPHRINEAFDLLDNGIIGTVFVSGVDERVTKEMLLSLWHKEEDFKESPCCIVLGHAATNTKENAIEASRWIKEEGFTSIRLITSEYHIPRAFLEFSNALPQIQIIDHPVKTTDSKRNFLRLAFSEYNKTLLTFFRHLLTP